MLASATSEARICRYSAAELTWQPPASNSANAARLASSARPSRPSAEAFSWMNSSASSSAAASLVLDRGIGRWRVLNQGSSAGNDYPIEFLPQYRLMRLWRVSYDCSPRWHSHLEEER